MLHNECCRAEDDNAKLTFTNEKITQRILYSCLINTAPRPLSPPPPPPQQSNVLPPPLHLSPHPQTHLPFERFSLLQFDKPSPPIVSILWQQLCSVSSNTGGMDGYVWLSPLVAVLVPPCPAPAATLVTAIKVI